MGIVENLVEAAMRIVMEMIIESDDARILNETEILRIERGAQSSITHSGLGLNLLEVKVMLAATQKEVVAIQAEQIMMRASHCAARALRTAAMYAPTRGSPSARHWRSAHHDGCGETRHASGESQSANTVAGISLDRR